MGKKRNLISSLFLAILIVIPTSGIGELVDIRTLYKENTRIWTETINVGNEQININAPINIPQADKAPIIKVLGKSPNEDGISKYENKDMKVIDKWKNGVVLSKNTENSSENAHVFAYKIINDFWSYAEKDSTQLYAKDQEKPISEAIENMNTMFNDVFDYENQSIWVEKVQFRINYISNDIKDQEDLTNINGNGDYIISGKQIIRDIPILLPVPNAFIKGFEECEWAQTAWNEIEFFYKNDSRYRIVARGIVQETDQLYENILLCDIETVKENLRTYIKNKKIDEIYSIELGFVSYIEQQTLKSKGKSLDEFILVPTWVVKCRYIDGKSKEEIKTPGIELDAYDYNNERCFQNILINAQTGEIYNPKKTGMDKYYIPKIEN